MTPILKELEQEHPKLQIVKINNEAGEKKITPAVPLIEIEEDGKIIHKTLGFKTKNSLSKLLTAYV